MKCTASLTCVLLTTALYLQAAEPATPEEQQLRTAIRQIQTQQAQMAENQAKIEAKLATIADAVRVARIYSSRAGH